MPGRAVNLVAGISGHSTVSPGHSTYRELRTAWNKRAGPGAGLHHGPHNIYAELREREYIVSSAAHYT